MPRLAGNSRNLAATCAGHKAVVAASNAFPLRDYFNLAALAEAKGGRRRMRVRGDNGCDKLVHVRRAKEPLERGDGLEEGRDCEEWPLVVVGRPCEMLLRNAPPRLCAPIWRRWRRR